MRTLWSGILVCALLLLAGCKLKPPPDPNDPNDVQVLQIDVLKRNLEWASQAVNDRVISGELTVEQGREQLAKSAQELLHSVKLDKINVVDAWQYGDIFRTAEDWELARNAYQIAVKEAIRTKNEDRRVNDSLHLAQALAHLGDVDKAIELARSTFSCAPKDKAPILMGTLYEVVPGAEGKKRDAQLAKVLEEAIAQHERAVVNPDTDPGKAFMTAKTHHLMNAWQKVIELYRSAGMDDEAEKARARGSAKMAAHQRV